MNEMLAQKSLILSGWLRIGEFSESLNHLRNRAGSSFLVCITSYLTIVIRFLSSMFRSCEETLPHHPACLHLSWDVRLPVRKFLV